MSASLKNLNYNLKSLLKVGLADTGLSPSRSWADPWWDSTDLREAWLDLP